MFFLQFFVRYFTQIGTVSIVEKSDFVNLAEEPPFDSPFFIDFSGFCCILICRCELLFKKTNPHQNN